MTVKRRVDESQHLGGDDRGVPVEEPKVRLTRTEGTDPQSHDRAEMRALGHAIAREHLAEDTSAAWQGLPDSEPRQLSESEQEAVEIGLETARSWGAQLDG
jgi:hypothetical protein